MGGVLEEGSISPEDEGEKVNGDVDQKGLEEAVLEAAEGVARAVGSIGRMNLRYIVIGIILLLPLLLLLL